MSTIQGRLWNSNKREGPEGLDFIHLLTGLWLSSSIRFALNNDRLHTYCAIVNDTLIHNFGATFWFFPLFCRSKLENISGAMPDVTAEPF